MMLSLLQVVETKLKLHILQKGFVLGLGVTLPHFFVAGCGTFSSLGWICVAGVELSAPQVRFAWQAWHFQ